MAHHFRRVIAVLLLAIGGNSAAAQEPKLKIDMPASVTGLAVTPDGSTVVVAFLETFNDSVRTWDLATGKAKSKLPVGGVRAMQLAADGNTLVLSTGKTIELWDLKTEKPVVSIDQGDFRAHQIALRPDGKQLASISVDQKFIQVWELPSGKQVRKIEGRKIEVRDIAYTPDGKQLISADYDGFQVHSANTGELIGKWKTEVVPPLPLAVRGDGKRIAYGSGRLDKNAVLVVDAQTGKTVHALQGHPNYVGHVAWNHDGSRLASVSNDKSATVRLWDAEAGKELAVFEWDNPGRKTFILSPKVAFSPDGKSLIAAGHYQGLRVWSVDRK